MSDQAIALNRFGLGARPDEAPPAAPRAWLLDQFDRYEPGPAAWAAQPTSRALALAFVEGRADRQRADADAKMAARQKLRMQVRETYVSAVNARADSALTTPAPFVERLVHFWSNHFAISADKLVAMPFAGSFEAEAIRPNVLGRFSDMLIAVEQHPAMQLFLDQVASIGPNSRLTSMVAGRNPNRKFGLNENLAREIMELHTLGVRNGYSQADVTQLAQAMTGWSISGLGRGPVERAAVIDAEDAAANAGAFVFRPALHEPGPRQIMGVVYEQPGEGQARAVLLDLAASPATARHVATKLARHFVADEPPPALVTRLATAFLRTGGNLPTLYRTLIDAPEAWAATGTKFKTPWDWLVSSLRGIGRRDVAGLQVLPMTNQLGQPVWRPGSPAGWDDVAASWAAPDALVRRVETAQRLANSVGDRIDARTLGPRLLPAVLTPATLGVIGRAESASTGLALLLVSPEFQRR